MVLLLGAILIYITTVVSILAKIVQCINVSCRLCCLTLGHQYLFIWCIYSTTLIELPFVPVQNTCFLSTSLVLNHILSTLTHRSLVPVGVSSATSMVVI